MTPSDPDASAADSNESRLADAYARHGDKVRFLIVGAWNTAFSYGVLWLLDVWLHDVLHYAIIMTLAWVISVTQNLFTFKLLVFRTKGHWLREYLRSYVVYAGSYLLNLAIVTAIMEFLQPTDQTVTIGSITFVVPALMIAAFPALVVVTIISYVGHKYYTYGGPRQETA